MSIHSRTNSDAAITAAPQLSSPLDKANVTVWRTSRAMADMMTSPNGYRSGYITTPYGIVSVYDQGGKHPLTALSFVIDRAHHTARWKRTFSDRYLKTIAMRFAASVVNAASDHTGSAIGAPGSTPIPTTQPQKEEG